MPSSTTITVRVSPETKAKLDRIAQSTDRTRSWLAAAAIDDYVDRELAFIEAVEKGLEDMRAGRTVPHDVAMAEIDAAIEQAVRRRA